MRPVEHKRGSTWSWLPDFTPGYTLSFQSTIFLPPTLALPFLDRHLICPTIARRRRNSAGISPSLDAGPSDETGEKKCRRVGNVGGRAESGGMFLVSWSSTVSVGRSSLSLATLSVYRLSQVSRYVDALYFHPLPRVSFPRSIFSLRCTPEVTVSANRVDNGFVAVRQFVLF